MTGSEMPAPTFIEMAPNVITQLEVSLCMVSNDPLVNYVTSISPPDTSVFFADFDAPTKDNTLMIRTISTPAQGKEKSGDQLILQSSSKPQENSIDEIFICDLDGITPARPPEKDFLERIAQDVNGEKQSDRILPAIVRKMMQYISPFSQYQPPNLEKSMMQIISAFPLNTAKDMWKRINDLYSAIIEVAGYTFPSKVSRPGMTGTIARFTTAGQSGEINFLSIADSPVLIVRTSGIIEFAGTQINSHYDAQTVIEIRRRIEAGEVNNAMQAREQLFKEGWYEKSYLEKVNNASVPVLNGQAEFNTYVDASPLKTLEPTQDIAAIILLSDGFFAHATTLVGNHLEVDHVAIAKLVHMLLFEKSPATIVDFVREEENRTFNPLNPLRERLSDDLSVIVQGFGNQMKKLKNALAGGKKLSLV